MTHGINLPAQGGFRPFAINPFQQDGMLHWDGVTIVKPGVECSQRMDLAGGNAYPPSTGIVAATFVPGTNCMYYYDATNVTDAYRLFKYNPMDQTYESFSNPVSGVGRAMFFNPSRPGFLMCTIDGGSARFYSFSVLDQVFTPTTITGVTTTQYRGGCYIPTRPAGAAQVAFTFIESGVGKIAFFDAVTLSQLGIYTLGASHIIESLCYCPYNGYIYATVGETGAAQNILVIDPTTRTIVTTITYPGITEGRRIIYCPSNNRLYATYGVTTTPRIVVINPETNTAETITPSGSGISVLGICYNPSNDRVYVTEPDIGAGLKRVHIINPKVSPPAIEASNDITSGTMSDLAYNPIMRAVYGNVNNSVMALF